jgi:basic amino acid/polyamine antiporter, APA family
MVDVARDPVGSPVSVYAGDAAPVAPPGLAAPSDAPVARQFGLPTATAVVVGSVIGTGVFALPIALAVFGPISLVAFVLVTIGAVALALTVGALSKRVPGSDGPANTAGPASPRQADQ